MPLDTIDPGIALQVAVEAARAAGQIQKKHFHRQVSVSSKTTPFDLVSNVDLECEQAIVRIIRATFPGHNILSEESTYSRTASPYTWIIDPLDGTTNFLFGLPFFCTSIALAAGDTLTTGVIYDVLLDELFSARKGAGAFLNGQKISVADISELDKAMLITGFYYDRGETMRENLQVIRRFFEVPVMGLRRLGSAALDLCYVAAGRATGFWEFTLSPWDYAAGLILVEEAGGTVTDHEDRRIRFREKSYVVASNGRIHRAMLDVIHDRPRPKA